ncbi:hypothetical protein Hdeb2414_s0010g00353651 [Helianthus debilis subsp. tardiflorus]
MRVLHRLLSFTTYTHTKKRGISFSLAEQHTQTKYGEAGPPIHSILSQAQLTTQIPPPPPLSFVNRRHTQLPPPCLFSLSSLVTGGTPADAPATCQPHAPATHSHISTP